MVKLRQELKYTVYNDDESIHSQYDTKEEAVKVIEKLLEDEPKVGWLKCNLYVPAATEMLVFFPEYMTEKEYQHLIHNIDISLIEAGTEFYGFYDDDGITYWSDQDETLLDMPDSWAQEYLTFIKEKK